MNNILYKNIFPYGLHITIQVHCTQNNDKLSMMLMLIWNTESTVYYNNPHHYKLTDHGLCTEPGQFSA